MLTELEAATDRLRANSWDVYIGTPESRDWMCIADSILADGRLIADAYLRLLTALAPVLEAVEMMPARLAGKEPIVIKLVHPQPGSTFIFGRMTVSQLRALQDAAKGA